MAKNYYACYRRWPFEVAIFGSKETRDQWVSHNDPFSKAIEDRDPEPRMDLTAKEALDLVGNRLYKKSRHFKDEFLDNIMWVSAPSVLRGGAFA